MKKTMFLGLMVMLTLSFAVELPTSGPEWGVFRQTACQGFSAWIQAIGVMYEVPYFVWDEECYVPRMPYSDGELCYTICGEEGLWGYYDYIHWVCEEEYGPQSSECQNAKRGFYSAAKEARGMFSITKSAHLSFARQALYANYGLGECETDVEDVIDVIMYSNMAYRECMAEDSEDFFGFLDEFCGMCRESA